MEQVASALTVVGVWLSCLLFMLKVPGWFPLVPGSLCSVFFAKHGQQMPINQESKREPGGFPISPPSMLLKLPSARETRGYQSRALLL